MQIGAERQDGPDATASNDESFGRTRLHEIARAYLAHRAV